jgi:8-oxo-dGTP pyrophosphatase MutT (NUDIX family)
MFDRTAFEISLHSFAPFDDLESACQRQVKQFLAFASDPFERANLSGHIVADAWILNPSMTKVVMIEHGVHRHWNTPGGHCDGSADVFTAAIREAEEEAGLKNLTPLGNGIFDIHTGWVAPRVKNGILEPTHLHFDVCYAFVAPDDAPLIISDESTDLCWIDLENLPDLLFAPSFKRRREKTLQRWNLNNRCAAA